MTGEAIRQNARGYAFVALIWLITATILIILYQGHYSPLRFRDPDDAMRLVQVRDFLSGQSWFDVTQHRANPPAGGPMHWSRLVDLPIAGFILLFEPFFSQARAELIACIAVPLLSFGLLLALYYGAVRKFLGERLALIGAALIVFSPSVMVQLPPLRIDHHGWQIVCAAIMLFGLLMENPRRGGVAAGTAAALWLHISSEGLPFAAVTGAVFGLRYIWDAREWSRTIAYASVLVGGSIALLLLTHGWAASAISYCDAISPLYLGPLLFVIAGLLLGRMVAGDSTCSRRLIPLALAGVTAGGLFWATADTCLAGPFKTLDPVVYRYWYLAIAEGLPIWQQGPDMQAVILLPSLVGLIGYGLAWRNEPDRERRFIWLSMAGLMIGAVAISLLVMRAMSIAHLLALPANSWLLLWLHGRIQSLRTMPIRVLSSLSLAAITPATLETVGVVLWPAPPPVQAKQASQFNAAAIGKLDILPPTVLLAPLDISPQILMSTHHAVIGTSHHRNREGMALVIKTFLSSPDRAHDYILRTQARYLIVADVTREMARYRNAAPYGLLAQIGQGRIPPWLHPVPQLHALSVYRIDRPDLDAKPPR